MMATPVRPVMALRSTSNVTQNFDVSKTLSQAELVLRTHRDWMKRRNPTIVPLQSEKEDELPLASPTKRTAWSAEERSASRSTSEQEQELQSEGSSVLQQREGGGAGAVGSRKKRSRSSKVSPAISVEAPPPDLTTAWLPDPIDDSSIDVSGEGEKIEPLDMFNRQRRPQSADSAGLGEASEDGQRFKGKAKKKRLSRGAVAPADVDPSDDSARRTPIPDVFFSPSASSITSLPEVNRAAWTTSTTSLALSPAESGLSLAEDDAEEAVTRRQLDLPSIQEDNTDEEDSIGKEAAFTEDHHPHSSKDSSGEDPSLNYQEFIKELHSASTATVIPIAPAPKHRTTSYLSHKHSKVGSENDAADASESRERLNMDEEDTPPLARSRGKKGQQDHSHIPDSTVQPVLPRNGRGAEVFVTSPEKRSLCASRGTEERTLLDQRMESDAGTHEDQKHSTSPPLPASPPTEHGVPSSQSRTPPPSSPTTDGDLWLEDVEEEYLSHDEPSLLNPKTAAWSTNSLPTELPLQLKDVGAEETGSVSARELLPRGRQTKLKPIKRHLPSLKSQDLRKSRNDQESPLMSTPPPPSSGASQGKQKKVKNKRRMKQQSADQLRVAEVDNTATILTAGGEEEPFCHKTEQQKSSQQSPDEHKRFGEEGEQGGLPYLMSEATEVSTRAGDSEEEISPHDRGRACCTVKCSFE